MRAIAHVLVFAAAGLAFFTGLGISLTGTTGVWDEILWIVAATLVALNVVWMIKAPKT